MSLQTQLTALVNAIAGDISTIWSLMNGKAANLDGLQTSEKSSLVAAINEVKRQCVQCCLTGQGR